VSHSWLHQRHYYICCKTWEKTKVFHSKEQEEFSAVRINSSKKQAWNLKAFSLAVVVTKEVSKEGAKEEKEESPLIKEEGIKNGLFKAVNKSLVFLRYVYAVQFEI